LILALTLPRVGSQMHQGTIHKLLAKAGDDSGPARHCWKCESISVPQRLRTVRRCYSSGSLPPSVPACARWRWHPATFSMRARDSESRRVMGRKASKDSRSELFEPHPLPSRSIHCPGDRSHGHASQRHHHHQGRTATAQALRSRTGRQTVHWQNDAEIILVDDGSAIPVGAADIPSDGPQRRSSATSEVVEDRRHAMKGQSCPRPAVALSRR